MSFQVQLEMYEGPLDLLLHLIKKNELSITDIPIAVITEQYLATLDVMHSLNLDIASEFLVMAATLIYIKSKMLLPPGEVEEEDEEDEEEISREELIRRLLEYQKFKEAALELEQQERLHRDVFARSPEVPEGVESGGLDGLSLFDLISAFRRIVERYPQESRHPVEVERFTVREQMDRLLESLHRQPRVVFQTLFEGASSRMELVVTFLALLELIRVRSVCVTQEEYAGPILVEAVAAAAVVDNQETGEGSSHGA